MRPKERHLKDGSVLLTREAKADDTSAVLTYINNICGESDYLRFGPGEFERTEKEVSEFLGKRHHKKD